MSSYEDENQKLINENKELKELFKFARNSISTAMQIIYEEENQKLIKENKELKELLKFAQNNIANAMNIIYEFNKSEILDKLNNVHYDISKKCT